MEKINIKVVKLCLLAVLCIFAFAGCIGNSGNLTEGLTNATNTFNYILTCEAGEYHLHEVEKWKDGDSSDALGVTTKCCGNQFWTSYNAAVLYTNKPDYLPEDVIICNGR